MMDTISIEINTNKRLGEEDFNSPRRVSNIKISNGRGGYMDNREIEPEWPLDEIVEGSYLPKVTYVSYPNPVGGGGHGYCYAYKITFSVPKFLYGNNIMEVGEDQFESVVDLLHAKLSSLALPTEVTKDDIRNATVRRVDYGKNILLPGDASMTTLACILERAEHRLGSKYTQVQYRDGDLYREGPKSRQLVVYDKIAEFCNTTQATNDIERLFVSLRNSHLLQVARVEVQIQNTKQLRLELKSLKEDQSKITFADVFSAGLAKRLLSKYWGKLTKTIGTEIAPLGPDHMLQVFESLIMGNSPQKAFAKLGFSVLAAECGVNKVKRVFCQYEDSKLWDRTKKSLFVLLDQKVDYPYAKMITEAIDGMRLIRIEEGKNDER